MDVIEMARQLGHALQKDERYIKMATARQASDEDQELQNMIGEFNLKRLSLNNETQAKHPSNDKIQKLNAELRDIYNRVMQNPHMAAYNEAKQEIDMILQRITAIVSLSAEGKDPDTADYQSCSCGCGCDSCDGCH